MNVRPADLTPFDAWLVARLCAGLEAGEIGRASDTNRPLIERMAKASGEDRPALWEEFLTTMPEDEAAAFTLAIAEVNPGDPAPEDDGWGAPELEKPVSVSSFPVDVFPTSVARLIREGAISIGCPLDFLGMTVLAVAGAAIGRSVTLRLKDNYFASAGFYIANVGKPGDGKSPAMNAVTRPLAILDQAEHKRYKEVMAVYEAAVEGYESAKKMGSRLVRAKTGRSRSDGDDLDDEVEEINLPEPTSPIRPSLGRVVVDDATTESLTLILAENPRGLLVAKDELTALMGALNQYKAGKGTDKQFFLSAWSGSSIVVDRKGNAGREPIRVQHPHLGIVGGIQPDMLEDLLDSRGRDDGFTDRILFTYPDPVPKGHWTDDGISDRTSEAWAEIVRTLRNQPLASVEGGDCSHVLNFTPSAKETWKTWFNSFRNEQNADDFPDWLRGPWAKLEQYAARIILTLHMLRWASNPRRAESAISDVEPQTVLTAVRLVDYVKSHLRRAHTAMRVKSKGNDAGEIVQVILKWIRRNNHESFSERDLTRNFPKLGQDAKGLHAALTWLEGRRCLRRRDARKEPGRRGRTPSPIFDVNPRLIPALEGRESMTHSASIGSGGKSVNTGGIAVSPDLEAGKEAGDVHIPF